MSYYACLFHIPAEILFEERWYVAPLPRCRTAQHSGGYSQGSDALGRRGPEARQDEDERGHPRAVPQAL